MSRGSQAPGHQRELVERWLRHDREEILYEETPGAGELNVEVPLRKELTAQTVPISVEQPSLAA